MDSHDEELERLRSVALQNANSILIARQRAENELIQAKEALEQKTAELADSLSMMRATLESTTDGILVTDAAARVTGFNENYVSMWGMPRELIDSRDHRLLIDFISKRVVEPEKYLARMAEIYATSPPESFDVLRLLDGKVLERYSRIQFLRERNIGRVWSFRDVTERRRAEEAVREESRLLELLNRTGTTLASQLELQSLAQAVTDAGTELSGATFGAFFYNPKDAKREGYVLYAVSGAPGEVLDKRGQPPRIGSAFDGEAPVRCDDVLNDPRPGDMAPFAGTASDASPVRSILAVPVMSRSGSVIGRLFFGHPNPGVFIERTERIIVGIAAQAAIAIDNARLYEAAQNAAEERRKLLERERSARADAERSNELKDEFLATVSHELRTPLSAILGWATILRRDGSDEVQLKQGLEVIERNARVQAQLIEDLLDMSRINSGKMRLEIQLVEPTLFIEAAIETVRPAADAKGIRLEKLLDPLAGPVLGDPSRLQQVVWNLLSNAIKFTPRDGRVQVVLERVNSHIEISVADTGLGIEPDFLPQVFDRFLQADASASRTQGGLGLGLSIVKNLVELHGGTVQVASPGIGHGTTFAVKLPLTVVHRNLHGEERLHPKTPKAISGGFQRYDLSGLKVLVVDDEADARDLISRVLEDCDAEVITAANADEAMVLLEKKRPHVLVSDIGMPNVDGYELLRRVRALPSYAGGKIPAIALTAFARSEDRTRALGAGFQVHVSKPVEPSELVVTIASVAGRTAQPGVERSGERSTWSPDKGGA